MKNNLQKKREDSFEKDRALFWSGVENARVRIRVGQEINDTRKRLGISQVELAKRCGTTQRLVSNIENGDTNVGIELLNRISKALNFDAINWSRIFSHQLPVPNIFWRLDFAADMDGVLTSSKAGLRSAVINKDEKSAIYEKHL